ncbi:gastrula zinc finger protein XlCGF64.1-like [Xyrauchen texanus]|uniref:gastrula zinc finger protein XlCGF64.1-like n=1 Tax=Xyrauchen texanus TaxID=154827 RepID=UPI0022419CE5|nr:gastrula zinc finger protein XlCGF64.1-like [Xyrauchen texanus]
MVSTLYSFQSQLASIMDTLVRTAVLEINKKEEHEVDLGTGEIKSQDNGEDGTCVAHCGEAVSQSPIKDVLNMVPYVDKGIQESETARVLATAESPELNRNISPGKMPSKECTSETGNNFSHPLSLTVSKFVRTCSNNTFLGDKHFVCTYCSKRFRCFSQLEIHQRSHTGEKPYRCTICGKRYIQKGHLYTHQRTHTGEKPYRCMLCGKGFIQKCTLDMHLLSHTGEKPFTCTKCGKGFTKKCNLNKHLACQSCNSIN